MKIIEIDTYCNSQFLEVKGDIGEFIRSRFNGYMEVVKPRRLRHPYVMLVDEEGLLKDLPLNPAGCYFYETDKHGHPIVGKVCIAKIVLDPINGYNIEGLSEDDLAKFTIFYGCIITELKIARREGQI